MAATPTPPPIELARELETLVAQIQRIGSDARRDEPVLNRTDATLLELMHSLGPVQQKRKRPAKGVLLTRC